MLPVIAAFLLILLGASPTGVQIPGSRSYAGLVVFKAFCVETNGDDSNPVSIAAPFADSAIRDAGSTSH